MEGMGARKIINRERQVKFIVAQIVRLLSVFEPGQLEPVRRPTVAEKDEDETPIRCFFPSCFRQLQRLPVEGEAFLQIEYVEIIVCESELDKLVSLFSNFL